MSKKSKSPDKSSSDKPKKHKHRSPSGISSPLSDLDLHLLGEGNHFKSYEKLGSKIISLKKKKGVSFTVWAPNAKSVSVVGEFNEWKPGADKMEEINHSGYWNVFIQGLKEEELYKYAVKSNSGDVFLKSDPYAFKTELRPGNASIVEPLKNYKWNDKKWMSLRKKSTAANPSFKKNPLSIYEVHPGSWKKDFDMDQSKTKFPNEWGYKNYRQLAHELVDYVKEMNYTHVELLPVMEHPLDISWGYQVVNFYSTTSRYGSPEDFMYFVDYCHQNSIGVILDWVPSHFPTDGHGLGNFDGKEIYAYENPAKGFHKEWGTYVFDYGKNEVRNFLISNALFWFEKYHIDGLRVDAVASMLYLDYSRKEGEWQPNIHGGNENLEAVSFIKKLNETVHKKHKGVIMIAEESTSWPGVTQSVHLGGLGFDMKWNMGWMHDILAYFCMDPIYRKFHHGKLTFAIWYAFNEKFLLPVSHDEVVHLKKSVIEKMPGDLWQKFANLRLLFGFMIAHPGKKLNFMGNDIAQYREWNSEVQIDWEVLDHEYNRKFHLFFKEINRLYKVESALHEVDFESRGFQWLDFSDSDNSVIAFARFNSDKSEFILFTFNMTPVIREKYLFGVPQPGFYKEILNSDADEYGGSGIGNYGGVNSENYPRFDFFDSIKVTLPPLGMNVYKWEKGELGESEKSDISAEPVKPSEAVVVIETDESDKFVEPDESRELGNPVKSSESSESKTISDDDMEEKIKEIINKIKKY